MNPSGTNLLPASCWIRKQSVCKQSVVPSVSLQTIFAQENLITQERMASCLVWIVRD